MSEIEDQEVEDIRFREDEATAHIARSTTQLLNDDFSRRLISRNSIKYDQPNLRI